MGYRLDAFDESAGIIKSHEIEDIPYMWGHHFPHGSLSERTSIVSRVCQKDPEQSICVHFDLVTFDQCSTLFSTRIADCGILGITIVFMLVGLMRAYLWRYWSEEKNFWLDCRGG